VLTGVLVRVILRPLLGLKELEKPATLVGRGGAWFGLPDGRQLHLGVEEPFGASRKAHPAFVVSSLDGLAEDGGGRFCSPVG
jgi:hypothetical protein